MRKITIEAGQLPELVAQPTYYDKILKAIKESEDGLTNHEICVKLNLPERRRASERISKMKDEGKVIERRCRCGHAPIYYFYK